MTIEENDALRWQLQGLHREIQPESDLWPGIAARLAQAPQPGLERSKRISARRFVPLAMAASVLLVVGMVWQGMPGSKQGNPQTSPLVLQQAVAMTFDYENALARMQETEAHPEEIRQAFGELDRSAAQILTAIDRDPHAVFLLEQLRRTYARRLQLTQRATMT